VLHDWSDEYGLKILKQLRGSATPDTKIVCVEMILPYACHDTEEDSCDGITGLAHVKAQKPLLANWGAVNSFIYQADVALLAVCNGRERTIRQFDRLFKSAGWKTTAVRRQPGIDLSLFSSIIAVPI